MIPNPDDYYSAMQSNQGWVRILESFARFVAPPKDAVLIDVGTGPGALVDIFRRDYQAKAIGLDYSLVLAARARQALEVDAPFFVVGRLPQLPLGSQTVDLVTATNVLYLLAEPETALAEIVRCLRPSGTFVMLNPSPLMSTATATALANERNLRGFERENFIDWGKIAEANLRWSVDDIETMFRQVGLNLEDSRSRIGAGLALYARGIKAS